MYLDHTNPAVGISAADVRAEQVVVMECHDQAPEITTLTFNLTSKTVEMDGPNESNAETYSLAKITDQEIDWTHAHNPNPGGYGSDLYAYGETYSLNRYDLILRINFFGTDDGIHPYNGGATFQARCKILQKQF